MVGAPGMEFIFIHGGVLVGESMSPGMKSRMFRKVQYRMTNNKANLKREPPIGEPNRAAAS